MKEKLTEKVRTVDSKFAESLHDVLFTAHYENCGVEAMEFGGITIPLIQMNGYSVYIYGYVKRVSALILYLERFKIKVCGIIDRNMEKTKIQRADGIPILHITQLDKIPDPQNTFVIIGVCQPSGVDEVWLNCGANVGDTVFLYFANQLEADTVLAVEGDKNIYKTLCRNLDRLPALYRKKVVSINEFIDENTDFGELMTGKAVSLINADIEGNELDLMKALSSVIARDRPVLALCAYHKESDLIDFVTYLDSIVTDYSYILRKYPSIGFLQSGSELVMYAVPFEREVS